MGTSFWQAVLIAGHPLLLYGEGPFGLASIMQGQRDQVDIHLLHAKLSISVSCSFAPTVSFNPTAILLLLNTRVCMNYHKPLFFPIHTAVSYLQGEHSSDYQLKQQPKLVLEIFWYSNLCIMFQILHVCLLKEKNPTTQTQKITFASANSLSYVVFRKLHQNAVKSINSLLAPQFFT